MRRFVFRSIVLLTCVLTIVTQSRLEAYAVAQPPEAAMSPATAPPVVPCAANSARESTESGIDCVAFSQQGTRGYIKSECLLDDKALQDNAEYEPGECHGNLGGKVFFAEAVAQARAIAQLNRDGVYNDKSSTGISPNIQWETSFANSSDQSYDLPKVPTTLHPDLLVYNHAAPLSANPLIQIAEVKLAKPVGRGLDFARGQAQAYVNELDERDLNAQLLNFNVATNPALGSRAGGR